MQPDNTIIQRPKCGRCKEGDAIIMWGTIFVCGKCAIELNEKKKASEMAFVMEGYGNNNTDMP